VDEFDVPGWGSIGVAFEFGAVDVDASGGEGLSLLPPISMMDGLSEAAVDEAAGDDRNVLKMRISFFRKMKDKIKARIMKTLREIEP
jgi:hypothetical protein